MNKDLNKTRDPAMTITERRVFYTEKNNTKALSVVNIYFVYKQVKNDKVISFG